MWHLRTWFRRRGVVGLTVGLRRVESLRLEKTSKIISVRLTVGLRLVESLRLEKTSKIIKSSGVTVGLDDLRGLFQP